MTFGKNVEKRVLSLIVACAFGGFALSACSFWHGDRGTVVFETHTPASTAALRAKSVEIDAKLRQDVRFRRLDLSDGWAFAGVKGNEFEHFSILWIRDNGLKEAEIVIQCSYQDLNSETLHALVDLMGSLIGTELLREIETTKNSSPFA